MRVFISILCVLMLAACGSEMQVSATLNATKDVKAGDLVFLSNETVGEVVDVDQQGDKTLLSIELNNAGESSIKQNAAIVMNRLKANAPLEIYNKNNEQELIQDDAQLTGLSSMFQLGAWMVGDSLDAGSDSLVGYVDAFQRYLDDGQFQQDKKTLQDGAEQLGKEVQGMADALTDEVKKTTQDLVLLEEKAAKAVEQFGGELAPVIGELTKNSQAIIDELEKFTSNIEAQNPEAKELGSTILSSLLKTLEKVNENINPQSTPDSEIDLTPGISADPAVQEKSEQVSPVPESRNLNIFKETEK